MLTTPTNHSLTSEAINTIQHLVLRPPRAYVSKSHGDGFGSYVERLINTAYETHKSFSDIIKTLKDLINYIRKELERTYHQYQFTIIIGNDFGCNENLFNHFAIVEHTGIKILIFSSIGTSYKLTTTTTNDIDDDEKPLSW